MIKVENLTKTYGNITAIDNISFEVGKGEILGFLGPNGAG
ncbi:MAG: ABC transporter ATP-binding protein, partial [Candidatus Dadabacteria bacterium]|nr:ABC transporter ATP-binding protein [Candidatus Dadabacteria bacterium]